MVKDKELKPGQGIDLDSEPINTHEVILDETDLDPKLHWLVGLSVTCRIDMKLKRGSDVAKIALVSSMEDQEAARTMITMSEGLAAVITDWSLKRKGEKLPINPETIDGFSDLVKSALHIAVNKAQREGTLSPL